LNHVPDAALDVIAVPTGCSASLQKNGKNQNPDIGMLVKRGKNIMPFFYLLYRIPFYIVVKYTD
jgi:hypothetical protein